MKKISNHFQKQDSILYQAFKKHGPFEKIKPAKEKDYFPHLCREIIGQQLSGKVAEVIYGRFKALFPKGRITSILTDKLIHEQIKNIGTSNAKTKYIKCLAEAVCKGSLKLTNLSKLSDEVVTKELTKVKGIGPWTAEMFLMFTLGREDIFSHGDLGLRRAIQKLYGFKQEPTRKQIEKLEKKWQPFSSYACLVLWQSIDA